MFLLIYSRIISPHLSFSFPLSFSNSLMRSSNSIIYSRTLLLSSILSEGLFHSCDFNSFLVHLLTDRSSSLYSSSTFQEVSMVFLPNFSDMMRCSCIAIFILSTSCIVFSLICFQYHLSQTSVFFGINFSKEEGMSNNFLVCCVLLVSNGCVSNFLEQNASRVLSVSS